MSTTEPSGPSPDPSPPAARPGRPARRPRKSRLRRVRVQTEKDVLAIAQDQINAVCRDPDISPLVRAQILSRLACVALKAIESRDLAARVETVQMILQRWRPL
jgi:hypothetical protein